jgi:glutamyl/glutaminyl-tRNA synthetase
MHIRALAPEELRTHLEPFIPAEWKTDGERLARAGALVKERLKNLSEFQNAARFVFTLPEYPASLLIWKNSSADAARKHLEAVRTMIEKETDASAAIMAYAEKEGRGEVLWPLRVALSGQEMSPGPVELLAALGKEEALNRITRALKR